MEISTFQKLMNERYGEDDKRRGIYFLTVVLTAEVGELADAIKKNSIEEIREELSDVIFTTISLANFYGIDMEEALISKYVKQSKEQVSKDWEEPIE